MYEERIFTAKISKEVEMLRHSLARKDKFQCEMRPSLTTRSHMTEWSGTDMYMSGFGWEKCLKVPKIFVGFFQITIKEVLMPNLLSHSTISYSVVCECISLPSLVLFLELVVNSLFSHIDI